MPRKNNPKPAARKQPLAPRLLAWYDRHGRHDLPWQRNRDPYAIWVSEIMLQQTQVATVTPYFERFLKKFPDLRRLARARLDSVLDLWAGLGYYSRARNLHRAAQLVAREHGGEFPRTFDAVARLPGIGRSTAGAILAQAFGARHPILDGNVRRVLSRYHAIEAETGARAAEQQLWALAEQHTPRTRVADYTQAIMDLGATLCLRTRPQCGRCPLAGNCQARALGEPTAFPRKAARRARPLRRATLLMIHDQRGHVLLVRRPSPGIWGGLWSFPEFADGDEPRVQTRTLLGFDVRPGKAWPVLRHGFTHFELEISPVPARLVGSRARAMVNGDGVWYNLARPLSRGVPAPVKRLLEQLRLRTV